MGAHRGGPRRARRGLPARPEGGAVLTAPGGLDATPDGTALVGTGPGCAHYATALDVVALRFWCCGRWYPCHLCHAQDADHPAVPRPRRAWGEASALCRGCGHVMTTPEYRAADACPRCRAAFNPGCRAHAHLYFAD